MKTIKLLLLCFLTTFLISSAKAQIVYTDVNPDVTGGIYHLDLNNDGVVDYDIQVHSSIAKRCTTATPLYKTNSYTDIHPLNKNKILSDDMSYPFAINLNVKIESGSHGWNNSPSQILSQKNWACRYNDYWGIHYYWTSNSYGNWGLVTDNYIGLRLQVGNKIYYGWLRMQAVSNSFIIKDYAFDSTPNHKILTGATSGARLASQDVPSEIFETFQLQIIPNPVNQNAVVIWESEKSGRVLLKIFDLNGRLVKTISDNIYEAGEHALEWNAEDIKSGIYFLQIQTGDFIKTEKIIVTK